MTSSAITRAQPRSSGTGGYGCFYKNEKAFWGEGGTPEQVAEEALSGEKGRIWCVGADTVTAAEAAEPTASGNARSAAVATLSLAVAAAWTIF